MKFLFASILTFFISANQKPNMPSIHSFKVKALNGAGVIDFSSFKGKKILIVNTASECGYTPQYKALQQLYTQYKNKLVIVGFPCNQFGGQEPGTASDIQKFCEKNYGVTFPLAEKIDVKGSNQAAIYKWLCNKSMNQVLSAEVSWNFNKFLLDESGKMLAYFPSSTQPNSNEILNWLK